MVIVFIKRKNKPQIESEEVLKRKARLKIENTIFDDKYIIFRDPQVVVNQRGIMDLQNNIVIDSTYETICSIGDYAIVSKSYNVYTNFITMYGIIDSNLNIIIDPKSERFVNEEGRRMISAYLALKLREEGYDIEIRKIKTKK